MMPSLPKPASSENISDKKKDWLSATLNKPPTQSLLCWGDLAGLRPSPCCKCMCTATAHAVVTCTIFNSVADSCRPQILFNKMQDTLLSVKCLGGSLPSPLDSKRLESSIPCKLKITSGKCFMVWMALVWACFLVEACSPSTSATCMSHK